MNALYRVFLATLVDLCDILDQTGDFTLELDPSAELNSERINFREIFENNIVINTLFYAETVRIHNYAIFRYIKALVPRSA